MNKNEKKRLRREIEEKERMRKALSTRRKIGEDIRIRGIGLLKIQILICPSFSNGECWDFRVTNEGVKVYKSIVSSEDGTIEPGYFAVAMSDEIEACLPNLESIKIPLFTEQELIGTADGTLHRVCFTSGVDNIIALSWNSNPPETWAGFVSSIQEILKLLRSAKLAELKA